MGHIQVFHGFELDNHKLQATDHKVVKHPLSHQLILSNINFLATEENIKDDLDALQIKVKHAR